VNFSINRHMKRALLLACAVLMLALPAMDLIEKNGTDNAGGRIQQQYTIDAATGVTPDAGLPSAGLARTDNKILKPNELLVRVIGTSHESCKAVANDKQDATSLDFRYALQIIQIQLHQEHFCASVSCRAPPVTSAYQYHI
jgi:hypothetical protein